MHKFGMVEVFFLSKHNIKESIQGHKTIVGGPKYLLATHLHQYHATKEGGLKGRSQKDLTRLEAMMKGKKKHKKVESIQPFICL
mmetsp:Transcript_9838/g.12815  ORF Transcript_9838/g.12815 Transcript_9838/m.12815 type:complete len:84 (-) Transcript_9838:16-267(-)